MRLAVISLMVSALLAGCSPSDLPSPTAGSWQLSWISTGGQSEEVVIGENVASAAWISLEPSVVGNGGCNDFRGTGSSQYVLDENRLVFGDVVATSAGCVAGDGDEMMSVENRFLGALWDSGGVDVVSVDGSAMVWFWVGGDTEFRFDFMPEG